MTLIPALASSDTTVAASAVAARSREMGTRYRAAGENTGRSGFRGENGHHDVGGVVVGVGGGRGQFFKLGFHICGDDQSR